MKILAQVCDVVLPQLSLLSNLNAFLLVARSGLQCVKDSSTKVIINLHYILGEDTVKFKTVQKKRTTKMIVRWIVLLIKKGLNI